MSVLRFEITKEIGVLRMTADLTPRAHRVPPLAVVVFCVGALAVTWWVSSLSNHDGPDHLIGPFHVPLLLEWSIAGAAVGLALFTAFLVNGPPATQNVGAHLSWTATAWLTAAAVLVSGCWRVITAGGYGANIGGGLVFMAGPFAVALLVQGSLLAERRARRGRLHHILVASAVVWAAAAVCVAVAVV